MSEVDLSAGDVMYPPGGTLGPRRQRHTALTELVSAAVATARTPLPTARPLLAALGSAIDLLAHTGLPVGEIADRTGFKSVYHFSRRVRQAAGMPPTQLRRERWAGR